MRLIVLDVCIGVTAVLFVLTMIAVARDRNRRRAVGDRVITAFAEYAWAMTPWLMVAAAALPAVRTVAAAHH